ncbi:MFS transporter [Aquabacterium sp. NJ1]|uniref:MFS transporter n=1 Tax=Aquabacterium sp. NJ1 TaxID=1538295 RepID=UPI00069063B3|nr:MFS transporter [Aquabacterium sp. NJ1]
MSSGSSIRQGPLALFLIGFVTFALLYAVQPLMPVFAREFHTSAAGSALALSMSTGLLAVSILASSLVARRFERRRLMISAILLATVLNALSVICTDWWQVLLCRALLGVFLGAVPATAMAYLGDTVEPSRLAKTMGLYVAGTAMGGMSGRVGIALVADLFGWRTALLGMSVLCLLAALGIALMMLGQSPRSTPVTPPRQMPLAPWHDVLFHPTLPKLFLCGGIASGIFVTAYNYAGFHLLSAPFALRPAQVGLIFSCYLFGVASSSLSGRLVDAWGSARVLTGSCATTAIGLAITQTSQLPAFILGLCLMTAGFFAMHAVCSGLVGKVAGPRKAQATSLYLLAYYVGSSVLGYAGGWLWDHGGWPVLSIGLLATLALFMWLVHAMAQQPDAPLASAPRAAS